MATGTAVGLEDYDTERINTERIKDYRLQRECG